MGIDLNVSQSEMSASSVGKLIRGFVLDLC